MCAGDGSFAGGEAIAGVVMQNHSRRKAQLGVELEEKKVLNPLNSPVWILRFGHYWANKLCWADKPIGPKDETI